jgi:hypothetical protein
MIDLNPVELTVQEQEYLAANVFKLLKPFEFLVRLAQREGDITGKIIPISLANVDKDMWINEPLVNQLRQHLSQRVGLAVSACLKAVNERQKRLTARKPKRKPRDKLKRNAQHAAQPSRRQRPPAPSSPRQRQSEVDDETAFRRKARP